VSEEYGVIRTRKKEASLADGEKISASLVGLGRRKSGEN